MLKFTTGAMVDSHMSTEGDAGNSPLAPDDAFGVLGHETRMDILQILGSAEGPLSFSELRDRVGIGDSGQFNYHMGQLEGHFVTKTDDKYALRQAGRRVVEAVLSGAVTDAPVLAPTRIDKSCWYCEAPIEVAFREERVELYCTECSGSFGESLQEEYPTVESTTSGYLGKLTLPPAGLRDRTPAEICEAGWTRLHLEMLSVASELCPRCSATMDCALNICETHQASEGLCEDCDRRYAISLDARCSNCIYGLGGPFMLHLLTNTDLLAFLTTHDYNPLYWESLATAQRAHVKPAEQGYDEELLSVEPFKARFTFAAGDDAISLTVGDDLTVVDVTDPAASEAR